MYVKWFDTGMFILCDFSVFSECIFYNFQISRRSVPPTSRRRRERTLEDRCRHRPEEMAGDAAGDTSRERRTR
ncbi:unnamed protein product [Staurois parvus]|uniref:Uncharacterized protein n=1 Tax=Staurois parvus TaxID=386267 RepID=A0ABN9DI97_9NEOB|nr:unnamed protein product [Staurois parvus]